MRPNSAEALCVGNPYLLESDERVESVKVREGKSAAAEEEGGGVGETRGGRGSERERHVSDGGS